MIGRSVRQTLGTGSPRSYAAVMAGLWIDLELTLARLDSLAGDAERLLDGRETLPALQYDLHCAAELVAGLAPPPDADPGPRGARRGARGGARADGGARRGARARRARGRRAARLGMARRALSHPFRARPARTAQSCGCRRAATPDHRRAHARPCSPPPRSPSGRRSFSSPRCSGCGCSSRSRSWAPLRARSCSGRNDPRAKRVPHLQAVNRTREVGVAASQRPRAHPEAADADRRVSQAGVGDLPARTRPAGAA